MALRTLINRLTAAMIYFHTKPDAVFEAILQEALLCEMNEVKMLADDGAIESWEGLYPETSATMSPYRAIRIMTQLLAATRDQSVYRVTDLHWLVLYECLQNFCTTHNDLYEGDPHVLRPVGAFRIGYLDGEGIIGIYFWDTDFLLRPLSNDRILYEEEDMLGEAFGDKDQQFLEEHSLHDDVPPLEMVEDVAWIIPDASAYFRTASIRYPDT